MEENNVMNNQETEEINENVEEVTEIAEDAVEEVAEEYVDAYDETEDYYENAYQKDPRKPLMITIGIMAVLILVLGALLIWKSVPKNSSSLGDTRTLLGFYQKNHAQHEKLVEDNEINESKNTEIFNSLGYANVSGQTLGDIYEQSGMEASGIDFVTFLKINNLSTDLTKDTYMEIAQYTLPLYVVGLDLETLETEFGIKAIITDAGEEIAITMDMPFGLVLDNMTVLNAAKFLYGTEDLETFKTEYGFGEEVTEETKWKEVRAKVEEAEMKKAEEAAAAAETTAEATPEAGAEAAAEATPAE